MRKVKFWPVLLIICLCFCTLFGTKPVSVRTALAQAPSTFTLTIGNYSQLKAFANEVNRGVSYANKTIGLTADIHVDSSFVSIGNSSQRLFKGKFYGNGFKITGLTKSLFGYTNGATIEFVETDGDIQESSLYLGALIKSASLTTIEKCRNTANVKNTYGTAGNVAYTGGLVGYSSVCTFNECSNQADVKNTSTNIKKSYVGGLFGYADRGSVNNCYVYNSTIEANAKDASKSRENILSGTQKNTLTKLDGWINEMRAKYQAQRDALYTQNTGTNQLIDEFFYYADLAKNYKHYEWMWVGGTSYTYIKVFGKKIAIPYWNFRHHQEYRENVAMTYINRGIYMGQAVIALGKIGFVQGDWETMFKLGKQSFKESITSAFNKAVQALKETFKSMSANNHYSFVTKKTKTVTSIPAYALGLGYTKNGSVNNCYSADLQLNSGKNQNEYNYTMNFTNEIHFVIDASLATAKTTDININIKQTENLQGLLSNVVSSNCYYFANEYKNLELFVSANGMGSTGNTYGTKQTLSGTYRMNGNILGGVIPADWFDYQKAEIRIDKNGKVEIYGAQNGNGTMCHVSTPNMDTYYPSEYENFNKGKKSTKSTTLPSGFSSSIWGIDSTINNGYPYLKYRYWQGVVA